MSSDINQYLFNTCMPLPSEQAECYSIIKDTFRNLDSLELKDINYYLQWQIFLEQSDCSRLIGTGCLTPVKIKQ